MVVSEERSVPFLMAADVVDFSVVGISAAYIKSTGEISTTWRDSTLDRELQNAKGLKIASSFDDTSSVNVAYIGEYRSVGGSSNCAADPLHGCFFVYFLYSDNYKERVVDVALGNEHTLLLDATGNVKSYGNYPGHNTAIPLVGRVSAISAGAYHNLFVLSNGRVQSVGSNTYCQSTQTAEGTTYPNDIRDAIKVSAGARHSLALLNNGTIVGWGCTSAASATVRVLEAIPPSDIAGKVVDISAGDRISAALLYDGTVRVWGEACAAANNCANANALVNVAKIIPGGSVSGPTSLSAWAIVMDPIITSTSATTFPINGGLLTINGEYLKNAAVYVDGRAVIPTVNTSNQLVVSVPRHTAGKARVEVSGYSHFTTKFDITYSGSLATPTASRTQTLTRTSTPTRSITPTPTATSIKTTPSVTVKSIRSTSIPTRTATKKPSKRP